MGSIMQPYIDLGKKILAADVECDDRTGAGTYSLFGEMLAFDVRLGAPFLTERKLPLRSIAGELLWFLEGSTNVDVLRDDYRCNFWNEWASPTRKTIGPMYGQQWRDADGVDQLANVLDAAIATPNSRRLVISTWIPSLIPDETTPPTANPELGKMALAPCHFAYQFRIYEDSELDTGVKYLDLLFHLRSSDYQLGLPANIASYYMLQEMVAEHLTGKTGIKHVARHLKVSLGDVHIYRNHVDGCEELLLNRQASVMTPRFTVTKGFLQNYMNLSGGDTTLTFDERRKLLAEVGSMITDYNPGAPIYGARNV